MDEARTELTRIIQDREMKDALLLVFANKQDVNGCKKDPDAPTANTC
jgi:ADP-ribosylation factor protein 6